MIDGKLLLLSTCDLFVIILHFFLNVQQPEMYDRIDQAALLRQEQLLKTQSLQSASLDGSTRYLSNECALYSCPNKIQFHFIDLCLLINIIILRLINSESLSSVIKSAYVLCKVAGLSFLYFWRNWAEAAQQCLDILNGKNISPYTE